MRNRIEKWTGKGEWTGSANLTARETPSRGENVRLQWLAEQLPDKGQQREYARERCALVLTELIGEAMERAKLSRAAVARILGWRSRSSVTNAMSAGHNMTIGTFADLLFACNRELRGAVDEELGVIEITADEMALWEQGVIVEEEWRGVDLRGGFAPFVPQLASQEQPA